VTERIRLDDMTDDQLDQLYAEVDRLTIALGIAESRAEDWRRAHRVQVGLLDRAIAGAETETANAQAAEAKLAAVRGFADQDQDGLCCSHVIGQLRRLLGSSRP
jgi:transposase